MNKEKQSSARLEAQKWADEELEWLQSEEGKRVTEANMILARQASERFRNEQRVDPERLRKPVTL